MAFEPIEKIREAEAEAQKIRQDASDSAKQIAADAERKIREELKKLESSATERMAESRASGQKDADEVYNKGCEAAKAEARDLVGQAEARVDAVASACVERILATWLS